MRRLLAARLIALDALQRRLPLALKLPVALLAPLCFLRLALFLLLAFGLPLSFAKFFQRQVAALICCVAFVAHAHAGVDN